MNSRFKARFREIKSWRPRMNHTCQFPGCDECISVFSDSLYCVPCQLRMLVDATPFTASDKYYYQEKRKSGNKIIVTFK